MSRHCLETIRLRVLGPLMLAAGLLVQASDAVAAQVPVIGMNVLWIPGDAATLRERFRKARALGVREIRLDWEWRQAEARRCEYVWDKFDTMVRAAHDEGVSLLPIVHYAPDWALRGGRKPADVYEMAPPRRRFPRLRAVPARIDALLDRRSGR